MRAWSQPPPPRLPAAAGSRSRIGLFDTLTGRTQPTGPESGAARMYVCGITPYDATHLGHANTYVAFDLLHRAWLDAGLDVRYVQNITDVDDPLLERAEQTGEDWRALAEREIQLFREDMRTLNVLPPSDYVGAVESIPLIVDLIEELRSRGAVYPVAEASAPDRHADQYFARSVDPGFGSLAKLDPGVARAIFAERGGDPDRVGKRDPLDCLVWRAERPNEPAWPSSLGPGRPGWHIECTAIALDRLGGGFDVQGGGSDLVFPHHEMCASESRAGGVDFARRYVHSGMVGLDGEKMSKSKGNLVLVSRLRAAGVDPMAVRLVLLAHHYRSDWSYVPEELTAAAERLERWRSAVRLGAGLDAAPVVAALRSALADDLDAPAALGAVDGWAAASLSIDGDDALAPGEIARTCDALLGVRL